MKGLYKVRIPLYCGEILVLFSDDFARDGKELGVSISLTENSYLGLAIRLKDRRWSRYLILIRQDTPDVIAHECLHVVNFILHDHGITIDTQNDEVQAYLLSWVVRECYKARDKAKTNG